MQPCACNHRLQSSPVQAWQSKSGRPLAVVRRSRLPKQHVHRQAEALLLRRQPPCHRQLVKRHAGPVDVMPTWTLDQIAGLAFGGLMLAFYFGAQYVDVYVAKQQRRELGLCEACGGVYNPATCKQDKCPLKAKAQ